MQFRLYDGEQTRELVNSEQLYDALLAAEAQFEQRFRGSMSWKRVKGREYLYRKRRSQWRSLGARAEATEQKFDSFVSGRQHLRDRIASLETQLRRSARINRALNLGRVPSIAARIIRRLAEQRLLGTNLLIVGTPALFAYERLAGGQLHPSLVATADLDLLLDARSDLRLLADEDRDGLIDLLRAVDKSFEPLGPRAYRAANEKGFMVDLITPIPATPAISRSARIGTSADELEAAEIEGLEWLQNSPRLTQTVIDEKGLPLRMTVPDPRAFALHKLWMSSQPSRDRAKGHRDRAQAMTVAALVDEKLPHLAFDSGELDAFPASVRSRVAQLKRAAGETLEPPDWR